MGMNETDAIKPVVWIGSTRAERSSFPEEVKDAMGYALDLEQNGKKLVRAKPQRGSGSAGIL
jgi:phage-related protein